MARHIGVSTTLAVCLMTFACLLPVTAARAYWLLDTGPGDASQPNYIASFGGRCDCIDEGIAVEFTIANDTTVTEVQAWMRWIDTLGNPAQTSGHIVVAIQTDAGTGMDSETLKELSGYPGSTLASSTVALAGQADAGWQRFSFATPLQPGTYWLTFNDSRDTITGSYRDDGFVGQFYGGAAHPAARYARYYDGPEFGSWLSINDPLGTIAVRISAVPEPSGWALLLVGLSWPICCTQRRRSNALRAGSKLVHQRDLSDRGADL